jgi:N-acetylglucosamine kinase-like BadF-type ATPase
VFILFSVVVYDILYAAVYVENDIRAAVEGSMHDHTILIAANGNGSIVRMKCNNIIVSSIFQNK